MIYLVDVDKTITKENTEIFLNDSVKEKINKIFNDGNEVWLFTCRPHGEWISILREQGLKFHGHIQKPYTDEGYIFFDDKFVAGGTKII